MPEILLVHPRENERIFGGMPPLGLGWIAAFLESKGFRVNLVDLQIDERLSEEVIRQYNPRIRGKNNMKKIWSVAKGTIQTKISK